MSAQDTPKKPMVSIMDDMPSVPRSVSAAALLAARTGQPQPVPAPAKPAKPVRSTKR